MELTIEQKAELFEIRRKMLQERSNMRFQLKELDAMTPRENNSTKAVSFALMQGPLNIWKEHSNCQIHSRGDSENPYSFTDTQYFLDFFYEIIFLCI